MRSQVARDFKLLDNSGGKGTVRYSVQCTLLSKIAYLSTTVTSEKGEEQIRFSSQKQNRNANSTEVPVPYASFSVQMFNELAPPPPPPPPAQISINCAQC
jgi:hypothetical protein